MAALPQSYAPLPVFVGMTVVMLFARSWTTLVPLMNMATLWLHMYLTQVVVLSTSGPQGITCLNSTFHRYCWPAAGSTHRCVCVGGGGHGAGSNRHHGMHLASAMLRHVGDLLCAGLGQHYSRTAFASAGPAGAWGLLLSYAVWLCSAVLLQRPPDAKLAKLKAMVTSRGSSTTVAPLAAWPLRRQGRSPSSMRAF